MLVVVQQCGCDAALGIAIGDPAFGTCALGVQVGTVHGVHGDRETKFGRNAGYVIVLITHFDAVLETLAGVKVVAIARNRVFDIVSIAGGAIANERDTMIRFAASHTGLEHAFMIPMQRR